MSSTIGVRAAGQEGTMTRWAGDNVVPLRRGRRVKDDALPFAVQDLLEASWAFVALERCIAEFASGRAGASVGGKSPIFRLRLQLPAAEHWLTRLGRISVGDWPDTAWAVKLGGAHSLAMQRHRAFVRSLYRSRLDTWVPSESLMIDAEDFAASLQAIRELIGERYPELYRVP